MTDRGAPRPAHFPSGGGRTEVCGRRHRADQALRPLVADAARLAMYSIIDIVIDDGEDVDVGQTDIGLDLFFSGRCRAWRGPGRSGNGCNRC